MKKLVLMLLMCAPLTAFAQTAPKFGHVDAMAIMQGLPEFIKARGELEAQAKQYEDEMKQMQDEIQAKSDAFDKAESTMTPTVKAEKQAELQGLLQKYQQALQDNQQAIQKAQQEKLQPIQTKIVTAIQNVGKNGGYVYIMDTAGGIPYISSTLSKDVTDEVKAEMNKIK